MGRGQCAQSSQPSLGQHPAGAAGAGRMAGRPFSGKELGLTVLKHKFQSVLCLSPHITKCCRLYLWNFLRICLPLLVTCGSCLHHGLLGPWQSSHLSPPAARGCSSRFPPPSGALLQGSLTSRFSPALLLSPLPSTPAWNASHP